MPPCKHLFEETPGVPDRCLRCRTDLQSSDGVGCEASGINPAYYAGLALTAAEQMVAEAAGWDVDDAITYKIYALLGEGPLEGDALVAAREVHERRALQQAADLMAGAGRPEQGALQAMQRSLRDARDDLQARDMNATTHASDGSAEAPALAQGRDAATDECGDVWATFDIPGIGPSRIRVMNPEDLPEPPSSLK